MAWTKQESTDPRQAGGSVSIVPRCYHSAVRWRDKVLLFLGDMESSMDHLAVESESFISIEKSPRGLLHATKMDIMGCVPTARSKHTASLVEDKVYLFGGQPTAGLDQFDDRVYCLDMNTKWWSILDIPGPKPQALYSHSATVVMHKIYVFGGCQRDGNPVNDMWIFDVDLKRWQAVDQRGAVPCPRSGHTLSLAGPYLILFGGRAEDHSALGDVRFFNLESNTWEQKGVDGHAPVARYGHTATLVGSQLYIFGGMAGLQGYCNSHVIYLETGYQDDYFQFERKVTIGETVEMPSHRKKKPSYLRSSSMTPRPPSETQRPVTPSSALSDDFIMASDMKSEAVTIGVGGAGGHYDMDRPRPASSMFNYTSASPSQQQVTPRPQSSQSHQPRSWITNFTPPPFPNSGPSRSEMEREALSVKGIPTAKEPPLLHALREQSRPHSSAGVRDGFDMLEHSQLLRQQQESEMLTSRSKSALGFALEYSQETMHDESQLQQLQHTQQGQETDRPASTNSLINFVAFHPTPPPQPPDIGRTTSFTGLADPTAKEQLAAARSVSSFTFLEQRAFDHQFRSASCPPGTARTLLPSKPKSTVKGVVTPRGCDALANYLYSPRNWERPSARAKLPVALSNVSHTRVDTKVLKRSESPRVGDKFVFPEANVMTASSNSHRSTDSLKNRSSGSAQQPYEKRQPQLTTSLMSQSALNVSHWSSYSHNVSDRSGEGEGVPMGDISHQLPASQYGQHLAHGQREGDDNSSPQLIVDEGSSTEGDERSSSLPSGLDASLSIQVIENVGLGRCSPENIVIPEAVRVPLGVDKAEGVSLTAVQRQLSVDKGVKVERKPKPSSEAVPTDEMEMERTKKELESISTFVAFVREEEMRDPSSMGLVESANATARKWRVHRAQKGFAPVNIGMAQVYANQHTKEFMQHAGISGFKFRNVAKDGTKSRRTDEWIGDGIEVETINRASGRHERHLYRKDTEDRELEREMAMLEGRVDAMPQAENDKGVERSWMEQKLSREQSQYGHHHSHRKQPTKGSMKKGGTTLTPRPPPGGGVEKSVNFMTPTRGGRPQAAGRKLKEANTPQLQQAMPARQLQSSMGRAQLV